MTHSTAKEKRVKVVKFAVGILFDYCIITILLALRQPRRHEWALLGTGTGNVAYCFACKLPWLSLAPTQGRFGGFWGERRLQYWPCLFNVQLVRNLFSKNFAITVRPGVEFVAPDPVPNIPCGFPSACLGAAPLARISGILEIQWR